MSGGNIDSWTFLDDAPVDTERYGLVNSPLKFCVLETVEAYGTLDYRELADRLDMPPKYAADRLIKYARAGLLDRERNERGRRSTFSLNDHGRSRLAHFREQA